MSNWRERARNVIAVTIALARKEGVEDAAEILKRIDAAYPFGLREYHPYKLWLDERKKAKKQLGLLPIEPTTPAVSLRDYWNNPPMIKPKGRSHE